MGVPGNGHSNITINSFKCCSRAACCGTQHSLTSLSQAADYANNNPAILASHIYVNPYNDDDGRNDFVSVLNDDKRLTFLCDKDFQNNNSSQVVEYCRHPLASSPQRQQRRHPFNFCNYFGVGGSGGGNSGGSQKQQQQKSVAKRYHQVAAVEAKTLSNHRKQTAKPKRKTPAKARMRGASGRRELEDDPLMRRPRRQLKGDSPKKQRKKLVYPFT